MESDLPLAGRRIVVTRPESQTDCIAESLRRQGAVPVLFPVIRIEPLAQVQGLASAIAALERYDWVIFTSVNAVRIFWDWANKLGKPIGLPVDFRVAAIGPATADSLHERGLASIFIPENYVGEALGEGVPDVRGKRILLPRAMGSRPALPEILARRGATVDEFALYRAAQGEAHPQTLRQLREGADAITFTSPSTVRQFGAILRESGFDPTDLPGSPAAVCIGPITERAARRAGYRIRVIAEHYTIDGLVEALIGFYRKREVACQ